MFPIRTILHPTDFSDYSACAFQFACSLARDYGAQIVVLHVAKPLLALAGGDGLMIPPAADRERVQEKLCQIRMEELNASLEHRLVEGDAATEILRVAEETGCDLIVMGIHGRTGIARLLMGSVAEQVVRKANCPVLTVKASRAQAPCAERAAQSTNLGVAAT